MPTDKTRNKIEAAIVRILQGTAKYVSKRAKLSVSGVAEEAGISPNAL